MSSERVQQGLKLEQSRRTYFTYSKKVFGMFPLFPQVLINPTGPFVEQELRNDVPFFPN